MEQKKNGALLQFCQKRSISIWTQTMWMYYHKCSFALLLFNLLNRKNLLESLLQTVSEASNFDKYIIEFVVATP